MTVTSSVRTISEPAKRYTERLATIGDITKMTATNQAAREALTGERKISYLHQYDMDVYAPNFVLEAMTNGYGSDLFGAHRQVTAGDIDDLFRRAKDVYPAERDEYYDSNNVRAKLYHAPYDQLLRSEFRRESDGWWLHEGVESYGPIEINLSDL